MGGIGSGRPGWHASVESCRRLPIKALLDVRGPALSWSCVMTFPAVPGHAGEIVSCEMDLQPKDGRGSLRLAYSAFSPAWRSVEPRVDRIALKATTQPFGGLRWWFVCPVNGALCSSLFLPQGRARFASRKAHRLAYAVQRMSPPDRRIVRLRRLQERLGGSENVLEPLYDKPKWMHWQTWDREVDRLAFLRRPIIGDAERELAMLHGG